MRPFWKKVLLVLVLLVAGIALLALLGGDGGTLPYAYEGFD